MMALPIALLGAASLGAMSSVHCAAMCGPLAAVGCQRSGKTRGGDLVGYLAGRAVAYAILGGFAGALGAPLVSGGAGRAVQIGVAACVGAVIAWRGAKLLFAGSTERGELVSIGRGPGSGGQLSRRIDAAFASIARVLPRRGVGLGLATAVFPCGALWSGLLASAATGSAFGGALAMAIFAVISSSGLLASVLLAARARAALAGRRGLRRAAGVLMLVLASWVAAAPVLAAARQEAGQPPKCAHCKR